MNRKNQECMKVVQKLNTMQTSQRNLNRSSKQLPRFLSQKNQTMSLEKEHPKISSHLFDRTLVIIIFNQHEAELIYFVLNMSIINKKTKSSQLREQVYQEDDDDDFDPSEFKKTNAPAS